MTDPGPGVAVLTDQTFDDGIADGTVLVDFWAQWCGPCHALTPVLDELAADAAPARIAKVDVAEFPGIGERFGVTSLPMFKNGAPVKKMFGAKNKEATDPRNYRRRRSGRQHHRDVGPASVAGAVARGGGAVRASPGP